MFPLHEATQRKLCRTLFVALCLAPTVLLAGYGLRLHTSGHRAARASELTRSMGIDVSLDDLVYLRPGQTRLTNVRLRDPETGGEIGQIRELSIADLEGRIVIQAAQPRLDARHFALVWRRLEDRLLRSSRTTSKPIELRAADLTITSPGAESQTLRHVLLVVTHDERGAAAELRYTVAGVAMPEPAVLRVTRRRSGEAEFSQELSWHTGGAALPVAPWSAKFPWLARLGTNCHFRGELTADETLSGWRGQLGGELSRIDLDALVSQQFPHKLSGEARAIVEQLRFDGGRIVSARGRIAAGPGVIGQSLVASAEQHLALVLAGDPAASHKPDALRRYSQLSLHFALDERQLHVRGECEGAADATAIIIGDERYSAATESSFSPLALVRVLSPASDHQVPATKATRSLVQVLPLPDEASPVDGEARGHVRGARE